MRRFYIRDIFNKLIFYPSPSKKRDTNKFFLVDGDNISLSSAAGRLEKVDKWVLNFFQNNIVFGDFGAASGITTLEFHQKAIDKNLKIESHIIDRTLTLKRYSRFPFNLFRNDSGTPIQFFFLKIPLIYLNSQRFFIPQVKQFITSFVKKKKKFFTGSFSIADDKVKKFIRFDNQNKIYLNEFDFSSYNSDLENKFNFIRFAHSLDYFLNKEPKKLIIIFNNIKKYLKDDSYLLLIIQDKNATLIRNKNNKFYIFDRFGKGAKGLEEFLSKNNFLD